MAPTENSQSVMNKMKKNYKKLEEIALDIKNHGLDEYEEVQDQCYQVVYFPRKNYDTFIINVRHPYHISK